MDFFALAGVVADDRLINQAAILEGFLTRAREEPATNPAGFATDFTRQDAAIRNLQRACEAAWDMGQHRIRRQRLARLRHIFDDFGIYQWFMKAR